MTAIPRAALALRHDMTPFLLAGFLAAAPLGAADAAWAANGPPGASVYALAAAPSAPGIVYAGTGRGVWRGSRGGAGWQPASGGLPVVRVQALAVDPGSSDTAYAGTVTPSGVESVGIFKTTDGGASWTAANAGLQDPFTGITPLDVAAISIDPSDPQRMVAGTRFSEIFGSIDGGATWTPRTFGGYNLGLETTGFARDPSDPQRIWAVSTLGLLLSLNGGASWSFFGNAGVSFASIAVDPTRGATLYAGNLNGAGIGKSTDGGATWTGVNANLPRNEFGDSALWPAIAAITVAPDGSAVTIATQGNGLFRSADGGGSWTAVDDGLYESDLRSLAWLPGGATLLAGGFGGGVYASDDGENWSPSSFGLEEALVSAVVANPAPSGGAWAATFAGIWQTADAGASWQRASSGLPPQAVAALASRYVVTVQPGGSEILYAGTLGAGLWASEDRGASWAPRSTGLDDDYVAAIALDPSDIQTLYAGTDHPYDGTNPQRVYKSTDGGATWRATGLDAGGLSIGALAVDPSDSSRVAAVSPGVDGYFQSTNGGMTWSVVTPPAASACGGVNTILYRGGGTVLAGATNGVCRSSNNGVTWTRAGVADFASVFDLLADPGDASVVYAAASPAFPGGTGGVFVSRDGGDTWAPVGTGLGTFSVRSVALDATGQTLYAGILRGGVAVLTLSGAPERGRPAPPPSDPSTRILPPRS